MKYIFVTGGVVSGLGKGMIAASLGRILKECGFENKSKIGERFLGLNDNIEKYKDFIKF